MKACITFHVGLEIESDDQVKSEELRKAIDIQVARLFERFEAIIIEQIKPLYPDCQFECGTIDDE